MDMTCALIIFITLGLCAADPNICPHGYARNTQDVFGQHNIQEGIWHRIPCPAYRPDEILDGVTWYKGSSLDDPSAVRLISRSFGADYSNDDRYGFSSDISLLIKGAEASDEGRYLCQVVPRDTIHRLENVDVQVLGDSYPARTSDATSSVSFQQGRRQTLPCLCASKTPDTSMSVVYWSMGEGVTTDTQIIGARFSDGTVVQIQHGADYSIGSDASLTINSLNDVQDTQRFWCHVFHQDGTLSNCYTEVQMAGDELLSDSALKASSTSFYLRKDFQQQLPCTSWRSGYPTCGMHWLKVGTSIQQLLYYNLSTNTIDTDVTAYDLGSDFRLIFKSVDEDHAGIYKCSGCSDTTQELITVRVIGDQFPLDDGKATAGDTVTFELGRRFTLPCYTELNITWTTKATVIWSSGTTNAKATTVIGTLSLPDGSKTMSDFGENSCLSISMEGSLLMNNCSQDGDVRYWCHVFPSYDVVQRSYVDVLVHDVADPQACNIGLIVALCVLLPLIFVMIMLAACIVLRQQKQRQGRTDGERGTYEKLPMKAHVPELDVGFLAGEIKNFVKSTMARLPITPWATWDDVEDAEIGDVYTPLELIVNVHVAGCNIRYGLKSEFEIFDDGNSKLSSNHVLIEGMAGCGKTSLLYKMVDDWYKKEAKAPLSQKRLVFALPVEVLLKSQDFGKAVTQYMLPKETEILADSINDYCSKNQSLIAILLDKCTDEEDVKLAMAIIKKQGLYECHVVMTTRHAQLKEDEWKEHNLRHITISGFTQANSQKYVRRAVENAEKRIQTEKTQACAENPNDELQSSNIEGASVRTCTGETQQGTIKSGDVHTKETFDSNDAPQSSKEDDVLQNTKKPDPQLQSNTFSFLQTTRKGEEQNICKVQDFLNAGIVNPEVTRVPIVIAVLCRLAVWTRGDAFGPKAKMGSVLFKLVEYMFIRSGNEIQYSVFTRLFTKIKNTFTNDINDGQLGMLVTLGKVVLHKICRNSKGPVIYRKQDFDSVIDGEKALELGLQMGLLCYDTVAFRQPSQDVNGEDFVSSATHNRQVHFVLEILEGFCAGVYIYVSRERKEDTRGLIDAFINPNVKMNVPKLADAFVFASKNTDGSCATFDHHLQQIATTDAKKMPRSLIDLQNVQKLIDLCLRVNFEGDCKNALTKRLCGLLDATTIRFIGISRHRLRLLAYFLQNAKQSKHFCFKSIELFRVGQYDWDELKDYFCLFTPGALECISDTSKADEASLNALSSKELRERIQSSNKDMPTFSPDQSDMTVIHTVQSLGLQELLESQSGECHTSTAASDLARCLPGLKMLENIVLVGTILCSKDLCDLAAELKKIPKLKKLDIRLNTVFDDTAFKAIANSMRVCKKLVDLRLSLYKVTTVGFDHVQKEIEKDSEKSWARLKTLYLLHGSPAGTFVSFLADSLKCIDSVESFHISGLVGADTIPVDFVEKFGKSMSDSKMCLKEFVIENMHELKAGLEKNPDTAAATDSSDTTPSVEIKTPQTKVQTKYNKNGTDASS